MPQSKYNIDLSQRLKAFLGNQASSARYVGAAGAGSRRSGSALGSIASEAASQGLAAANVSKYQVKTLETVKNTDARSPITGASYFDNVTFSDGEYSYVFPNDPLITPDLSKKIEFSEIVGGIDVDEFIRTNSVYFSIKGLLFDGTGNYPRTQLADLVDMFYVDKSLEVESWFINSLRVSSIVVTRLGLPPMEGFPDCQPYEIEFKSVKPVELIILEG